MRWIPIACLVFFLLASLSCRGLTLARATATPIPSPTSTFTPTPSPTVTRTLRPTFTLWPTSTPLLTSQPTRTPGQKGTPLVELPWPVGTPEKSWKTLLIMPDAFAGQEENDSYRYVIKASLAEVHNFYLQEMPRIGWYLLSDATGETGNILMIFQKDEGIASIAIIAQQDVTLVLLVTS